MLWKLVLIGTISMELYIFVKLFKNNNSNKMKSHMFEDIKKLDETECLSSKDKERKEDIDCIIAVIEVIILVLGIFVFAL